ncbi:outer membrane beta-barrel protein [Campylobacter avium]|uniref:outer membrane beta-barrel protein n=1 Tax=Campylobacter avium TaxID=522485 RepID=UPI00255B587F|nr:outer membrane beta-barrel protein [Campylobacter avium]
MKKFLASVAVVAALSTSAVAEESGYFAGLSWGYGSAGDSISWLGLTGGDYKSALRFGVYGGYTQMFDNAFGARYYATLDFGGNYTDGSNNPHVKAPWNLYVNADAIYNFTSGGVEFGAFGGLGLGYVNYEYVVRKQGESKGGVDLGLNLGLRANYELFGSKFTTELYTRTGLYSSVKIGDEKIDNSIIGLRTSYNF